MNKKNNKEIQFSENDVYKKLIQKGTKAQRDSETYSNISSESQNSTMSSSSKFNNPNKEEKKKQKKQKKKFSWPVFKRFFKYTAKRWKLASAGLLATIISGFFTSIMPYNVGKVLDSITQVKQDDTSISMEELNEQILSLFLIIMGLGLFSLLRFNLMQYLQQNLAIDMKTDIYSTFIKNDMYFFEQYKSGELVSRLGTDVNQAKSAVSNNLTFLIRNFVTILGNIIILFIMSWKLTLSVMAIIPLYAAVTIYYNKRYKPLVVEYQDVLAQMSAHVGQKFSGIQLVKAYSTEDKQIQNYNKINLKSYEISKKKIMIQGIYMTSSVFLPAIAILVVLWYGGKLAIQGNSQLTPGELTAFIMYCTTLANNTSGLSSSYANIINGTSAVQKVFDMLGYQSKVKQNEGEQVPISGEITFQNVQFNYPLSQVTIFKNLCFKIKSGEYVAFVGQSGSGKSTIIKLIEQFYKITAGNIIFDETNSKNMSIRELRKQIGMVNQQATIFSGTIQQNITYGLDNYTIEDLERASAKSGCLQFINNSNLFPQGFQTILGEKGSNLSGGQRQRISIARALIRKPKIIIFDEATSALDANSQQMVQQSIQSLALAEQNKITIIVIAHRLSTVIKADKIFVMKEGDIIQSGNHEQLKEHKGYYYELVEKQLQQK